MKRKKQKVNKKEKKTGIKSERKGKEGMQKVNKKKKKESKK